MSPINRRDFLKGGSMAVAVAGVAGAVPMALPTLAGAAGPKAADTAAPDSGADEAGGRLDQPLVAHVRNLETGEIGLFYGDSETICRDPKLAAQLRRAVAAPRVG
jgi:hypothetical protein